VLTSANAEANAIVASFMDVSFLSCGLWLDCCVALSSR
jgi:hypothetical protein